MDSLSARADTSSSIIKISLAPHHALRGPTICPRPVMPCPALSGLDTRYARGTHAPRATGVVARDLSGQMGTEEVPMTRTQVLPEIRRMRLKEACGGWQSRRLTQEEAVWLLGVCERTACPRGSRGSDATWTATRTRGGTGSRTSPRGLGVRPRLHPTVGVGLAQLGHDVGVEQPAVQRSTSRTGLRTNSPPKSSRLSGERDRSSCRLASLGARRRSNSSTPTTTCRGHAPSPVVTDPRRRAGRSR